MPRALLLCLCIAACKKPAPPPARFCDQDLSGVWLNATDKHFAYRFRDHGDIVRGEFMERSDDGALKSPDEPILFELHRTDRALAGVMRSTQPTKGGRTCPVEFGLDVTSCGQNLQATVEMDVSIGEDCKRTRLEDGGEPEAHRTEFVFVRDALHPSGGGDGPDAH
jgi:hypothetical protein